ncbi:MAG: hypothetical protein EBR30_22470 [Cytophagia bacterium]|nr:hypothetical protein [Cytophagia bacterium]
MRLAKELILLRIKILLNSIHMKKFIKFLAFTLAMSSFAMFQSCDEEDPLVQPTVTEPSTIASVQVGGSGDVTFTFESQEGYASSTVSATGGTAVIKTNATVGAQEGSIVVTFTADNSAGAASVKLILTDAKNQTAEATAILNKTISAPPSVQLSSLTGNANPGATSVVLVTVAAENGFASLSYTTTGGLTGSPVSPINTLSANNTVEVTLTVPANAAIGSTLTAVFTARDNQNLNSTAATYTVTVTDPNPTVNIQGSIAENRTLIAGTNYLLIGQVFVESGVTLTIPAGTVIKGDKASKATLIVKPGGRLVANGQANNPVVFTSSQVVGARDKGDWGGLVILGTAYVNQTSQPNIEGITPAVPYGNTTSPATNADQNSGTLNYVRIEYAGIELSPNNETNSLTLGGVGNGTSINYVQVSFGGDDGFEWFGGTVNAKYLVSHSTWDDDFDTDFGWSGNVQFGLVVRNPFFADQSGSNAFESDNQGNGNTTSLCDATASSAGNSSGCTRGVFSNITVLGPRETNSRSISGSYQNALHIRRRSSISIFNSFISGFRIGLRIDDDGTYFNLAQGNAVHANNVLSNSSTAGTASSATATDGTYVTGIKFAAANDGSIDAALASGGNATPIANYWLANNTAFNNVTATTTWSDIGVTPSLFWAAQTASNYPSNPNFALGAGVAGANNLNSGAAFSNAKLTAAGSFFTTTTFRGAFGATDWTDGWAEFQPLNKAY